MVKQMHHWKIFSGFTGSPNPTWDDVNLISGFTSITGSTLEILMGGTIWGPGYDGKMLAYTTLSLKVAGNSPTTKGTISGTGIEGSVSFDVSYNELTLDNANISGPIEWNNGSNDLTIKLKGKNSVIINKEESAPVSVFQSEATCSLKVEKGYSARECDLEICKLLEQLMVLHLMLPCILIISIYMLMKLSNWLHP
jgi:hypothetical protein